MLIQSLCHSKLILTAAIQIIINFIVEHSRHTTLSQRAVQVKYLCKCCLAVYHYIVHTTIHRGHIAVFTYSSFFCRSHFKFFAQQINYIAIKLFCSINSHRTGIKLWDFFIQPLFKAGLHLINFISCDKIQQGNIVIET